MGTFPQIINFLSLFFAVAWTVVFGHYVIRNSVNQQTSGKVKALRIILVVGSASFYFSTIYWSPFESCEPHMLNLFGLFSFVLAVGFLRAALDYLDINTSGGTPRPMLMQNMRDTIWNMVLFLGIYASIANAENGWFRYSGYLLCMLNIARMIKYRFYDDLFIRDVSVGESMHGREQLPSINLVQGLFNLVLRSYLYVTVSFGCIYTLMYFGSHSSGEVWFDIDPTLKSGSMTFDFIYFSIVTLSTVGFGDISPIYWSAKLVSIAEILVGYMFIGTLMALIVGRFVEAKALGEK